MHDVGRARSWYKDANKIADMAQSVERVLGKDEVTSSNLVISSKKTDRQSRLSVYFVLITELYRISLTYGALITFVMQKKSLSLPLNRAIIVQHKVIFVKT